MILHSNAIAQDCTSREGAGGIDGNDADARVLRAVFRGEFVDKRTFSGSGCAGNADQERIACDGNSRRSNSSACESRFFNRGDRPREHGYRPRELARPGYPRPQSCRLRRNGRVHGDQRCSKPGARSTATIGRLRVARSFSEYLASNHQALNFACALTDGAQFHIAIIFFRQGNPSRTRSPRISAPLRWLHARRLRWRKAWPCSIRV